MTLALLVAQAARARELRPLDVRVLVAAAEVLDFGELRPLKPAGLALEVHVAASRVTVSLARLAAAGFLVCDRSAAEPRYRLPFTRAPMPRGAPRIAPDGRSAPEPTLDPSRGR